MLNLLGQDITAGKSPFLGLREEGEKQKHGGLEEQGGESNRIWLQPVVGLEVGKRSSA